LIDETLSISSLKNSYESQENKRLEGIADDCFVHNRLLATLSAWRAKLAAAQVGAL
jgi:hypothetical protein